MLADRYRQVRRIASGGMVISLTATPMMCGWLLKEKREHGYLYNQTEKFYRWIISTYASALDVVLNHPASVLMILVLTMYPAMSG